ncbi:MAG TPA: BTAD domain-containing putative transcriptional regulator [Flexivirga sp.]|uniref:AfsR/SARP family transcriptional regulator n=1 Tax=Flexivirga sp. TaxID=1962927 RepID=UPI002B51BB12|nr:BTAD domain-containing putative transcriptional regulator [Flexivirga sp.]HWC22224.1 BTAD domain-containing putative transcriptional regulator [Flexivirga sp.]
MRTPGDCARLRVLGHVELLCGSTPLPLSQLERSLLARVAMCPDGGSVSAESLVPWIWGDDPPSSARNRVQALVSGLRRKGRERDLIETTKTGYRLADGVRSDCEEWRELTSSQGDAAERWGQLSTAIELFNGPPLQNIPLTDDVHLAQQTLAGERLTVIEECNELALELGELRGLTTRLTALVQDQPFHEGFAAQLMRVLARAGRQEEALRVYRDIYRRLDEELGVAPSEVLRAAHQDVLNGADTAASADAVPLESEPHHALPEPPPTRPPTGTAPATDPAQASPTHKSGMSQLPVPRTLPRNPSHFVGRDDETTHIRLAAARAANEAVVVTVTGLTGVGKSALAIRAAREVQDDFPDGTLYADLGNTDGLDVSGILGSFLRLLGVRTRAIPEDVAARTGLFRSVLEERRVVIVIDNLPEITRRVAEALEQILPVSAGSLAIVTSRGIDTEVEDWSSIRLRSLEIDDARALLCRLIGQERVAADDEGATALLTATGRLPLAIRLVAGRLAHRPDRRFGPMAQRLLSSSAGSRDALDGLRKSVQMVWERRTEDEQHAIALIAHLPLSGISGWMPGTILHDEDDGDDLVEMLLATNLIEPVERDNESTSYRLHSLVAQFARARHPIDDTTQHTAITDLGRELLRRASSFHDAFHRRFVPAAPPMPDDDDPVVRSADVAVARAFFRADGRAMLTIAAAVVDSAPELSWRLLVAAANAQHTFAGHGSWLGVASTVRDRLDSASSDQQLGRALLQLAEAWHRQDLRSESRAALAAAGGARKALTLLGANRAAAAADIVTAQAALSLGRRQLVEAALARAEGLLTGSSDPTYAGWASTVRGVLHNDYDELEAADHELMRARELLATDGDRIAYATATIELARVTWRQHHLGSVNVLLTEVTTLLQDLGEQHLLSYALDARSEMSYQLGRDEDALQESEIVWRRAVDAQDLFLAARARRTKARALAALGRLDEAEEELRESIEECTALDRPLSVAAAMHDLSVVLSKQGQHAAAGELRRQERAARASADLAAREEFDKAFGRQVEDVADPATL